MRLFRLIVLLSLALCCGCCHSEPWRFNDSTTRKAKLPRKLKKVREPQAPQPIPEDDSSFLGDIITSTMWDYSSGDPNLGQGRPYPRDEVKKAGK